MTGYGQQDPIHYWPLGSAPISWGYYYLMCVFLGCCIGYNKRADIKCHSAFCKLCIYTHMYSDVQFNSSVNSQNSRCSAVSIWSSIQVSSQTRDFNTMEADTDTRKSRPIID